MQYAFIILLILVIVPYAYAQCSSPGVWSPWVANGCNDTCGMYGLIQMIRICLVPGTCNGSSTMSSTTPCGAVPCAYPRLSCIPGFTVGVLNNSIVCIQSG